MSTGPLRRAIGSAGLLALVPVLIQLASGAITPEAAAIRGLVIAVVVVVLGRLARLVLVRLVVRMERRREEAAASGSAADGAGQQDAGTAG